MGVVSGLVGAVVVLFSLVMVVVVPLLDAQVCLPSIYPPLLVKFKLWCIDQSGDFLSSEKPGFFVGLAWVELLFLWPLSIANVYGILLRRPWAATTTLMAGVSSFTSMAAVMGEVLCSDSVSEELLERYLPYVVFPIFAIIYRFLPEISDWCGSSL
ncbi:hypothetical protein J5N97_027263 [Dioscorea zingiberensis]|uniref:EXPERA domain-containing protein n=1 Tax=Dioscorea zingiberensis TaxID=325984 RepID=A0A9D5C3W1_9LILI|nr:hypothetical protein J5N97_027263 [Dioscorea zingiberensis]